MITTANLSKERQHNVQHLTKITESLLSQVPHFTSINFAQIDNFTPLQPQTV